ncbi:aminotransferase class I/II-fold pyridoxal phosphate-dependent enzyme [Alteromonas facilis]|uniref:aminotransferase class I/II-fold pyridoxal phosphate-dependent enzyme n=1 Tax=Alteromonas facilis TaxID=2048004 RepID=UPI000C28D945|nr:aminotransferase class V-fold PLP-dependent enzyme [Alteromonas facilis]
MIPLLKILIVEPNEAVLDKTAENLLRGANSFERNDVTIDVVCAKKAEEAISHISNDGDIQAVILGSSLNDTVERSLPLLSQIKQIRHELPVYIIDDTDKGLDIVTISSKIEALFYHDDVLSDPESIVGYVLNDFDDRAETPFWTAYKKYAIENNDSWHTPGHSGGASFRNSPFINDFYRFFGRNVFVSDLSVSVDSLGSLTDSTNAIGKAQESVAKTFEVNHSYFVTNGSSTSNKIVLQTLLREGDKVIVDRNCHKSVHYGMVQSRAMPLYLDSVLNKDYGIFAPPSLAQIAEKIEQNPDAKLIVLTGCTYDGLLTDLKQVVDLGHRHGMKVFIDEAWFAYSMFHPAFRYYSAIHAGADYVTHSAHKVVSAFSQASYIHIQDPDFDIDFFKEIYAIHTSTSPKYQIMASLDVCSKQLEMEGYKLLNGLLRNVDELRTQAKRFKRIRILDKTDFANAFPHFETDNIGHDPLKILIDISELKYSNHEIHRYLMDEVGLEIEKFTHSTLLVLLTLGGMKAKIVRLFNALNKLDEGTVVLQKSKSKLRLPEVLPPIQLTILPATAFFGQRESIALNECVGRVAAALITPYPPGIPLLVPGQLIEAEHVEYLNSLAGQKLTIQGLREGEIYVLSNDK